MMALLLRFRHFRRHCRHASHYFAFILRVSYASATPPMLPISPPP
jgi:hypothetical protein